MNDDELNRLVIERARQRVETRQVPAAVVEHGRQPLPQRDERPALWGFLAVLLTLTLGGLLLLPGSLAERLSWVVHGVCAKEHTLSLGGVVLPLCQRNTGIYSGFLATVLTLALLGRGRAARLPTKPILVLLGFNVAWMGLDGFNSLFLDIGAPNLYPPQPVLRILSGLAMGMSMGTMLVFAFNSTLRANPRRDQRVLGSWRDVAAVALVELALFALIQLAGPVIAYPLAIFSTLGILLVMFGVNVLVIAMVSRYEGAVTRMGQLARPGMLALVLTALEFGLLAWARIAVESSVKI
ncbi:MAG TPA: DUF2085 domain-containing protein [Herpetosiphonaceae bacterium]|nr:DUF2085 domain-containing protein [Herpetosiphonaceae bacterium]